MGILGGIFEVIIPNFWGGYITFLGAFWGRFPCCFPRIGLPRDTWSRMKRGFLGAGFRVVIWDFWGE